MLLTTPTLPWFLGETCITFKRVNISQDREDTPESDESYNILDILNRDCLDHILAYVPIIDMIRSERVSKRWQSMVQEHLDGELEQLSLMGTRWKKIASPQTIPRTNATYL